MDTVGALSELGLPPGAPWSDIKQAYRARISLAHPDHGGTNEHASRLNEAYAVLQGAYAAPPDTTAAAVSTDGTAMAIDDDSLAIVAPPDEVFERLLVAVDAIASITYVDEASGYFEAVLPDTACQLVIALQGRGAATEAFFSLEPLGQTRPPLLRDVVRDIATRVRTR